MSSILTSPAAAFKVLLTLTVAFSTLSILSGLILLSTTSVVLKSQNKTINLSSLKEIKMLKKIDVPSYEIKLLKMDKIEKAATRVDRTLEAALERSSLMT
ncbi:hypothetical protein WN944_006854 [Citrus x changshan-huyou]|uniref:Uncharacterized protein n=1 Tax=Citrus x changshan-huyou TaxID=2935761 RepID=A0AAP0MM50_9ROSI